MARGRMLNKKISLSKRVNELPGQGTALFAFLIAHLDCQGCFWGSANMVKSQVFPRKEAETIGKVETYLKIMEESIDEDGLPLIVRYEVNGDRYLWMPGFEGEQMGLRKDREEPQYPPLPTAILTALYPQESREMPPEIPRDAGKEPAKVCRNDNDNEKVNDNDNKKGRGKVSLKGLEDYIKELRSRFPDLDFDAEFEKFKLYWGEGNRKLQRPKLALLNWMTKAEKWRGEKEPAPGGGRGVPKEYTPPPGEEG